MAITRHGIGTILTKTVVHGDTIYLQGFTADDKNADMKGQTKQVLAKIDAALAEAGSDKSHILFAQIFVSDIGLRPQMNEIWTAWLDPKNPPARACVGVQLEGNTKVEIVVTAAKKS